MKKQQPLSDQVRAAQIHRISIGLKTSIIDESDLLSLAVDASAKKKRIDSRVKISTSID